MARQLNQMQDWARETRLTHGRIVVLTVLMLAVMAGLLYRYFYLQIIQNETFRAQSDRNRIAVRAVAPTRGVIVDRLSHQGLRDMLGFGRRRLADLSRAGTV